MFQNLKVGSIGLQSKAENVSNTYLDTEMYAVGQSFSLREIISRPESFLNDKIFEIKRGQTNIDKRHSFQACVN